MVIRVDFDVVLCTKSGMGFKQGVHYAVVGRNNGVHVFRTDENDDPHEVLCHEFGCELWPANDQSKDAPVFVR